MAGHRGIEPLLLDLESNVLPLTLMTYGASEEARTLDLLLGKQTFYQLNYTRNWRSQRDLNSCLGSDSAVSLT